MKGFWLAGRHGNGIITLEISSLFFSLLLAENMGKTGLDDGTHCLK